MFLLSFMLLVLYTNWFGEFQFYLSIETQGKDVEREMKDEGQGEATFVFADVLKDDEVKVFVASYQQLASLSDYAIATCLLMAEIIPYGY